MDGGDAQPARAVYENPQVPCESTGHFVTYGTILGFAVRLPAQSPTKGGRTIVYHKVNERAREMGQTVGGLEARYMDR